MNSLSELLTVSSSTRRYFIKLPVWLQMELHSNHNYIATAERLHIVADILQRQKLLK